MLLITRTSGRKRTLPPHCRARAHLVRLHACHSHMAVSCALVQISAADQMVWLARRHGFDAFVKVPCVPASHVPVGVGETMREAAYAPPV